MGYIAITGEDLRKLCVEHEWFTAGTNEQYEKLMRLNECDVSTRELAVAIYVCTDDRYMGVTAEDYIRSISAELDDYIENKKRKIIAESVDATKAMSNIYYTRNGVALIQYREREGYSVNAFDENSREFFSVFSSTSQDDCFKFLIDHCSKTIIFTKELEGKYFIEWE